MRQLGVMHEEQVSRPFHRELPELAVPSRRKVLATPIKLSVGAHEREQVIIVFISTEIVLRLTFFSNGSNKISVVSVQQSG